MTQPQAGDDRTLVPVIPVDYIEHSKEHPFCFDPSCPCHEDMNNIAPVNAAYQEGLVTSDEASNIAKGRQAYQ